MQHHTRRCLPTPPVRVASENRHVSRQWINMDQLVSRPFLHDIFPQHNPYVHMCAMHRVWSSHGHPSIIQREIPMNGYLGMKIPNGS